MNNFKKEHSFEARRTVALKILQQYPDRIPIVATRYGKEIPEASRVKFLAPRDATASQFISTLRGYIPSLKEGQAIFLFVGKGEMAPLHLTMHEIYGRYGDDDGMLYIGYSGENTFG